MRIPISFTLTIIMEDWGMAIDYVLLGQRIKKFRKMKQLKQAQLAELIGTSPSNISHIERGKMKPSLQVVVDIANQLEVPMDRLMYGNVKESSVVFAQELEELLSDCDVSDRKAILTCAEQVKKVLQESRREYNPEEE